MNVEQIYTGCLSQGSYFITSGNEAVVIDPLREVKPYLERANKNKVKIKYVLETHFHADFVSGHLTLAKESGAEIVYGPNANPEFPAKIAQDGEILSVGSIQIKVIHTPGHTMESCCFLLIDENGNNQALFTGDTLFLGDVGRPDLAQNTDITQGDLAGMLFDSLRNKIMVLEDSITVYPGHGAGSACGKNMMKETLDSLGNQKKVNYALRSDMSKEEFIKEVTTGLIPPPGYFPLNVKMNKEGYENIDRVIDQGLTALTPEQVEAAVRGQHALILDVRSAEQFSRSHIPNSIFIGLDGSFAPWVGELIVDVTQPLVLVADEDRVEEAITRLARVGFDHTLGYLKGGIDSWIQAKKEIGTVDNITAPELADMCSKTDKVINQIVDVRKESEHYSQHIIGTKNYSLSTINNHIRNFDDEADRYVHCAGGYRSMIACSILKSRGVHCLVNVIGGFKAIQETSLPLSDYLCPTTYQPQDQGETQVKI